MGQWGYCFCPELFPVSRGSRIPNHAWDSGDIVFVLNCSQCPGAVEFRAMHGTVGILSCFQTPRTQPPTTDSRCGPMALLFFQSYILHDPGDRRTGCVVFLNYFPVSWAEDFRPMHGAVMGYFLGPWAGEFQPIERPWLC